MYARIATLFESLVDRSGGVVPAPFACCTGECLYPYDSGADGAYRLQCVCTSGKPDGVYPEMLRQIANASGCKMAFAVVPRARLEMLFETGQADADSRDPYQPS
jgi:polar amino acid transport system substrate-binding protein